MDPVFFLQLFITSLIVKFPDLLKTFTTIILILFVLTSKAQVIDSSSLRSQVDSFILLSNYSFEDGKYLESISHRKKIFKNLQILKDYNMIVTEYSIIYTLASYAEDAVIQREALDSTANYLSLLDRSNPLIYSYHGNRGYSAYQMGNYATAIKSLERSINGFDSIGMDLPVYHNNILTLIDAHNVKGNNTIARDLAQKYYGKLTALKSDPYGMGGDLLQRKGVNQRENADYADAIKSLLQAESYNANTEDENLKKSINNNILRTLARTYIQKGSLDTALYYIDLSINERLRNKKKLRSFHYTTKGEIHFLSENYEGAIDRFREGYNYYSKLQTARPKTIAIIASQLGESYLRLNNIDSAKHYLDISAEKMGIAKAQKFVEFNDYLKYEDFNKNNIHILSRLAEFDLKRFKNASDPQFRDDALSRYAQAFRGSKYLQKELLSKASKYSLQNHLSDHFPKYVQLLFDLYEETDNINYFNLAFQTIEDNKAIVLKEDIYEKRVIAQVGIPKELLETEQQYQEQLNILRRQVHLEILKTPEAEENELVKKWKGEISDLFIDYNEFQKNLENDYPKYFDYKYKIEDFDIQQLQKTLKLNEAYLNYTQLENQWYCIWISNNDQGLFKVGDQNGLSEEMSAYLTLLKNTDSDSFDQQSFSSFKKSSFALKEKLLDDELAAFNSYIISPTGLLHYLPFETLMSNEDLQTNNFKSLSYLIKNKNIQYTFSSDLWLESLNQESLNQFSSIAFAPFTGNEGSDSRFCSGIDQLSSLACSEEELLKMKENIPITNFQADQANLNNFKSSNASGIIHLATHACLDDEDPQFNKLIFSDDYLAIEDLENMQLKARLAVLSACNTGTGAIKNGEGVINLGKGFRSAGVKSLITSLWSINDCATSTIVGDFYKHLSSKEDISSALRLAKLDYLESADKRTAHPYYWAGLVFTGNTDALASPGVSSTKLYIFLMVGIIGLLLFLLSRRKK